mgnify:CR=1 FL=1
MSHRVLIMGAAGRDFHNFNVYFKDNSRYNVVGFTATQIPDIEGRKYPAELAGSLYPQGIPIYAEEDLSKLIKELEVDDCVFAYSDVPYQHVMTVGALVNAAGGDVTDQRATDAVLFGNLLCGKTRVGIRQYTFA